MKEKIKSGAFNLHFINNKNAADTKFRRIFYIKEKNLSAVIGYESGKLAFRKNIDTLFKRGSVRLGEARRTHVKRFDHISGSVFDGYNTIIRADLLDCFLFFRNTACADGCVCGNVIGIFVFADLTRILQRKPDRYRYCRKHNRYQKKQDYRSECNFACVFHNIHL